MAGLNWYTLKIYSRDRFIFIPAVFTAVTQLVLWWYAFASIDRTATQVILHYTVILGPTLSGEWWKLLYLPLAGGAIALLNFAAALGLYTTDRLAARLLAATTPVLNGGIFIILWLLIRLNG